MITTGNTRSQTTLTDGEALLRTILDNPDDDAPRLIYADWLDEHARTTTETCTRCNERGKVDPKSLWDGVSRYVDNTCPTCKGMKLIEVSNGNAEKAEFIRVQVELARHDPPCSAGFASDATVKNGRCICEPCSRRWREKDLLDTPIVIDARGKLQPRCLWAGLAIRFTKWEFRRGFVGSVIGTAEDCLKNIDAILERHPVREVTLTTWPGHFWRKNDGSNEWVDSDEPWPGAAISPRNIFVESRCAARWPGITFHLPQRAITTARRLPRVGNA